MKKFSAWTAICSVLILICACGIGAVGSSALSMEGQIILSQLASAGTELGIDIGSLVSTTAKSDTESKTSSADAQEQLGSFLENLDVTLDVSFVTDMISYLQAGNSFADWVYEEFGESMDIPESVREMSNTDVMLYLVNSALNPTQTSAQTSGSDYIFTTTEAQEASSTTQKYDSETESRTSIIIYPSNATSAARKTGDVDNDGRITAADARLALRASARLETLSADAYEAADVNGNGVVNAKDARSILRYAAKLANSF